MRRYTSLLRGKWGVVIFGVNEVVHLRSWRLDDRKPQTAQIGRRKKQEVLSSRN